MKKFWSALLVFTFLSFALGIGWGVVLHKKQDQAREHMVPLRVLCGENWLSTEALDKFSQDHNTRIQEWTYTTPSEFLRQMANADGKVDVICTSSLLLKSLVHSAWLKKTDFKELPNSNLISVDFSRLPFDPESEYSIPLFWNLYGFFGKSTPPDSMTWKQMWQGKKVTLWGEELNVLQSMSHVGLNLEERLQQEEESTKTTKNLDSDIRNFAKKAADIIKPELSLTTDAMLGKADWAQMPLARAAHALDNGNSQYHYWLPADGATVEVGVLTIGEKSQQPALAKALINELISTEQALGTHERLGSGVVHNSLTGLASIEPMQKPQALRQFPLTRLQFPDLNIESLPRFQKLFDDEIKSRQAE